MPEETKVPGGGDSERRGVPGLRELLRRDFLTTADWERALAETAQMARDTLGANTALVALYEPATNEAGRGEWSVRTHDGEFAKGEAIRVIASLTVLDRVRATGEPALATAELPALLRSRSASRHDLRAVLAVPLQFWSAEEPTGRRFGGCLYADRRRGDAPFTDEDVELVRDLASVAERNLSLVRQLTRVRQELSRAAGEVEQVRGEAATAYRLGHYESRDPEFARKVLDPLRRAAQAGKVGLLLLGPTGTGKSHLARAFHYESRRASGPFVVLDCGQVTSAEALGAELFGYAKRSGFSAPPEGRLGKAELADGGTLFLDEIGSMPLELQQRLLRLVQHGRFSPLGSAEERDVDVQVVAAANQDLKDLVRRGRFREDLYFRLAEVVVELPPLSSRRADIRGFVELFLAAAKSRFGRDAIEGFDEDAMTALRGFDWASAGNLRGLEHAIHRTVLLAPAAARRLGTAQLAFEMNDDPVATPRSAPRDATSSHTELLRTKIGEHRGVVAHIANDDEIRAAFGVEGGKVAASTLRLRIRRAGLEGDLATARDGDRLAVAPVRSAIRRHRSTEAAAAALGVRRDRLLWFLRQNGLSVREILAEDRD